MRERFGAEGVAPGDIRCERATYVFRHPAPPGELLQTFRQYYGPTMNAFESASKDGREAELESELTQRLSAAASAGIVRYGLHRQDAAMMTCFTPSALRSDHVHFIDGAGGGYASAATALKAIAA